MILQHLVHHDHISCITKGYIVLMNWARDVGLLCNGFKHSPVTTNIMRRDHDKVWFDWCCWLLMGNIFNRTIEWNKNCKGRKNKHQAQRRIFLLWGELWLGISSYHNMKNSTLLLQNCCQFKIRYLFITLRRYKL